MRSVALIAILAGCAAPGAVTHVPSDRGRLQLELVRYAGRMTVRAWVDEESNLVFRKRLDRETFALPVEYTKAREARDDLREASDGQLRERLETIDRDYEFEVSAEFEKFWKTGPFTTPAESDRVFPLDDRLASPGLHAVRVEVEPDTVSWSVTFRLVRVGAGGARETLHSVDLDSGMHLVVGGTRIAAPPIYVHVPPP